MKINPQPTRSQPRASRRRDRRLLHLIRQSSEHLIGESEKELKQRYQALRTPRQNTSPMSGSRPTLPNPIEESALVGSFALVHESLRRTTNLSAYDVQILAGLAMTRGTIAEMQTGEGKTLASAFPIAAHALAGTGVHVATVNAYLAERDFHFLHPVLDMLGITSGISLEGQSAASKRAAYACDVTFATGYELGFDFLRDQIAMRALGTDRLGAKLRRDLQGGPFPADARTQRGFAVAIIDEIDSVFIDEATTPLVLSSGRLGISGLGTSIDETVYRTAKQIASSLAEDTDFTIDASNKSLVLTEQGIQTSHHLQDERTNDSFPHQQKGPLALLRPWRLYIESALRAEHMMIRDINYVVRENRVEIVDEYTGRIFSDRNWRDGLHQAVEAKEGVPVTEERKTIAKISRQRYFQRYDVLCGMTGTADGHQRELQQCYRLPVVIIPRRKELLRQQLPTRYFHSESAKTEAVVVDIQQRHSAGQPVLVGTRTIQQSINLSERLSERSIRHQVLNGIQDGDEATLIAAAGLHGEVTVATNMAGRGTDIKLEPESIGAGGLHVIGYERNSSARIDRQLMGRAGRQGDPGSGQFYVSADDDLIVRYDAGLANRLKNIPDASGTTHRSLDRRVEKIQQTAESVGYQSRRDVMREELWIDKVKKMAG